MDAKTIKEPVPFSTYLMRFLNLTYKSNKHKPERERGGGEGERERGRLLGQPQLTDRINWKLQAFKSDPFLCLLLINSGKGIVSQIS